MIAFIFHDMTLTVPIEISWLSLFELQETLLRFFSKIDAFFFHHPDCILANFQQVPESNTVWLWNLLTWIPDCWPWSSPISFFREKEYFSGFVFVCARASSFSNLITCVLSCLRFRFCLYLAAGCTLLFPSKLFFLFAPPPFSRTLYFYANTKVKIKDFRSDLFAISTIPVVDARKVSIVNIVRLSNILKVINRKGKRQTRFFL